MQFEKDINSEQADLFLKARDMLLSYEGIEETKKERITTYSFKAKGLCHMRTMHHGIDFGFLKGVKMKDKFQLLKGKGKLLRVLSLTELNTDVIHYYIDQGIELNKNKL